MQGREPPLDGVEQQIADVRAADPGVDHCPPGDDLAVMGVDEEGAADDIAVPSRVNSNPSLHQRRFERNTMTLPSWTGYGRSEYLRASNRLWAFMIR